MIPPALPGRCRSNQQRCRHRKNQKLKNGRSSRSYRPLLCPNSGMIILLLVLFAPIAFFGIKYSKTLFDRRQKILEVSSETVPIYRKYDPANVALIAARHWNPTKMLSDQDLDAIYEAAYDSGTWCHKSTLGGAITGLISADSPAKK